MEKWGIYIREGDDMDINLESYVRVGSTKVDVKRILGEPSKVDGHMWTYNASHIKFDLHDQVIEWKNMFNQLDVGMCPYKASYRSFELGSSMDEVLLAMGSPTAVEAIHDSIWKYEASHIKFDGSGHVIEWKSQFEQLKKGLRKPEETTKYVHINSTKDEVLSALGAPSTVLSINSNVWKYHASHVVFEQDKVVEWKNDYGQLDIGMKKPEISNDYLRIGMTEEEVLKVLGSPTDVLLTNPSVWKYHASHVKFNRNKVVEWKSMFGQLKDAFMVSSDDGPALIGMSKDEVRKIMGSPTSLLAINPDVWCYNASHIKFKKDHVIEWRNMFHQLDMGFQKGDNKCDDIRIGSSESDVLNRLGTPTCILEKEPHIWHYGNASVAFNNKKEVISWENIDDIKKAIDEDLRRPSLYI